MNDWYLLRFYRALALDLDSMILKLKQFQANVWICGRNSKSKQADFFNQINTRRDGMNAITWLSLEHNTKAENTLK